jgi:hypothetical protein
MPLARCGASGFFGIWNLRIGFESGINKAQIV